MMLGSDFGKVQYLLNQGLNALSLRHEVISNNIANADTPYFKRSEVVFESELLRALGGGGEKMRGKMIEKKTHKEHISFYEVRDYKGIRAKVRLEYDSVYRNDKNNVDIDKEMVDAARTSMRYNMLSSVMGRNYKKLQLLIRG